MGTKNTPSVVRIGRIENFVKSLGYRADAIESQANVVKEEQSRIILNSNAKMVREVQDLLKREFGI